MDGEEPAMPKLRISLAAAFAALALAAAPGCTSPGRSPTGTPPTPRAESGKQPITKKQTDVPVAPPPARPLPVPGGVPAPTTTGPAPSGGVK